MILKLDSIGAIAWEKTFGGSGGDFAQDVLRIPGGGYMVAAQTQSVDIPGGGYHGGADILVAELDDSGTLLRELCFGGTSWDVPGNILLAGDGGYLLGSVTYSNDWDVTANHGMYDLWIVKHGEGMPINPPELIVDATDSASSALIPGATISLFDVNHGEWQNVTAGTGSYTFTSSGASQQYALVPGTAYQLAASADGYSPAVRDITFSQDGQRETLELMKPEPEVFTYSMTEVLEDPSKTPEKDRSGFITSQNVERWLGDKAGWKLIFNKSWSDVTKADFGTEGGGLNDATLHWHTGHGAKNRTTGDTFIGLQDFEGSYVSTSDVEGKWGGKNKWTVLVSCEVLSDEKWGKALSTSHGIFGFNTSSVNDPALPPAFFHYAMEEKWPLYDSWRRATKKVLGKTSICTEYIWKDGSPVADYVNGTNISISAGVLFKTREQLYNDHLPGYGTVEPDGDPNSSKVIPMFWNCSESEV